MLRQFIDGTAAKFIVSVLGAVAVSLNTYYGTAHWSTAVIAVIVALGVFLVPNSAKPA